MNASPYSDIFYIAAKQVLLAIHRPTGRWCSVGMGDIEGNPVPEGYGRLETLAQQGRQSLVDDMVEGLALYETRAGTDNRSFEYLLLKCTSACNYSCTYCYDHDDMHTSKNLNFEKTVERVKEAIDLARSHLTLLFHGGEPLIKKRFVRDVTEFAQRYADETGKRIFFKIQTHGGMFTDEIVEFLTQYNFFVGISMDGPADINDKFRILKNGKGTYEKFNAAYRRYGDFMRARCGIITTPTTGSAQHLLRVARHFRDLGFRAWRTTNYLAIGRVQDEWSYETDTDTYINSILALVDAIEVGEFDGFYIGPVISLLTNLLSDERPDMCTPGNNSCGAGRRFLSVEADGAILPCDTLNREKFTVGNISVDSLKSALQHPNSKIIAESLPRSDCQSCSLLGVCGGTCLGLSSLTENRKMLCHSYKRLYPKLMRRLHHSTKLLDYFEQCSSVQDEMLNLVEPEGVL
jgi:uncharacterized protein